MNKKFLLLASTILSFTLMNSANAFPVIYKFNVNNSTAQVIHLTTSGNFSTQQPDVAPKGSSQVGGINQGGVEIENASGIICNAEFSGASSSPTLSNHSNQFTCRFSSAAATLIVTQNAS
ncbi:MAG: hypothetical protein KIT27_11855 [Legionellales bacterium]|nr:hypothetical protein [Legionellales bacterium]